ncbi:uncharacterized protein LOC123714181 isoform X3 [Pieris brassicae]|uniref:uncharacterized protein LOC123714181 isoform X3 n=1 Tax=Pieris brassicae TaxID=7116 RepID=UPI001E660B11|nr:uncharacterized protein LOC123714181 isoform X3 [Pieris brassicae]
MAKPLQKERENRSADKKDLTFHPYNITPESAYTSILLLESREPEILCQTLRAITKFSAQEFQNRQVLFDLNAIRYILPHVEHPELNIKRFALKALAQLCQLPRGPEQVLANPQNLRKISYMLVKIEDVFVLEFASLVLSELTREPVGCEQLVSCNILNSLCNRMKNSLDPDVQKNCLQTLSNLLEDPVCASEVTKNQQFSWASLLALMQSPYLAIQHAALKTVDQLICRYKDQVVQKSFRASTGVLDLCDILESYEFRDVHTQVLGVLRNYVETEENAAHLYQSGCILRLLAYLEMALPAMKPHCLGVLTKMSFNSNGRDNYHVSTRAMLNPEFMVELLNILQRIDICLKIKTCTVLSSLMKEDLAKDLFTSKQGEEVISNNLHIEHIGLRTALCQLIFASVTEDGADVYVEMGTVHYMVENKQARYTVSAWESALEAIFRQHPSAKLAYTGRLDINDFTQEGFYVLKKLGGKFPTIQQLIDSTPPHHDPVFVTMFHQPYDAVSTSDIRMPYFASNPALASQPSRLRLPKLPDDVNLRNYLLRLKIWFGDPAKSLHYFEIEDAHYEVRYRDKCEEVTSSLKQRAQLLAEFVVEQMSGLTQERDCSMPSVDLHLADLMEDLGSRVLGLGWIRCGGPLERAILYKVLADRVGLPCALHRKTSAHAWCEVAIPELDPRETLEKEESYPAGLLRANYVVDLMSTSGSLLPRGSVEARKICGAGCTPYTAREVTEACRCTH